MKSINLVVVGATGLVGRTFLSILEESIIPIVELRCIASKRSKGKLISFRNKEYLVEELQDHSFDGYDIAFFTAGSSVSKEYVPKAIAAGCIVIDNTSYFRLDPNVPLIIPKVNFSAYRGEKIISNPNCSTIQCLLALHHVAQHVRITRIIYSTYQSVSGSGYRGVNDLFLTRHYEEPQFYPYPIHDTCIPQVDDFLENGYTKEEMKMILETKKILGDTIVVSATCVRVPILYGHGVSMTVELAEPFQLEDIFKWINETPGVVLLYPPALPTTYGIKDCDEVYVGRLRKDLSSNGFCCYVTGNNLRIGAATNALHILLALQQLSHKN